MGVFSLWRRNKKNRKKNNPGWGGGLDRTAYDSVELGPLIPLRPSKAVLALSRTKLAKVLCRLGDHVLEELKLDAAQGFACRQTCQCLLSIMRLLRVKL